MSCGLPAGLYAMLVEQLPWLVRALPAAPRLPLLSAAPVATSHKTRVLVALSAADVAVLHAAADRHYYGRVNDALRAVLVAAVAWHERAAAAAAKADDGRRRNHHGKRCDDERQCACAFENEHEPEQLVAISSRHAKLSKDHGQDRAMPDGRNDDLIMHGHHHHHHHQQQQHPLERDRHPHNHQQQLAPSGIMQPPPSSTPNSFAADPCTKYPCLVSQIVLADGSGFHRRTHSDAFSFVSDEGTDGEDADGADQRAGHPSRPRSPVLGPPGGLYASRPPHPHHKHATPPPPTADLVALPVSIGGAHMTWLRSQAKEAGCDVSSVLRANFRCLEHACVPVFPNGETLA